MSISLVHSSNTVRAPKPHKTGPQPDSPARVTAWSGQNGHQAWDGLTAREALKLILERSGRTTLGRWWVDIEAGGTITTMRDARALLDQWEARH